MSRKITKWSRNGKTVRVKRDDWFDMLRRMKASVLADPRDLSRGSGGCESFCGTVCEDEGGCEFSFGEDPECGAACESGEVFLQEEV